MKSVLFNQPFPQIYLKDSFNNFYFHKSYLCVPCHRGTVHTLPLAIGKSILVLFNRFFEFYILNSPSKMCVILCCARIFWAALPLLLRTGVAYFEYRLCIIHTSAWLGKAYKKSREYSVIYVYEYIGNWFVYLDRSCSFSSSFLFSSERMSRIIACLVCTMLCIRTHTRTTHTLHAHSHTTI